LCALYNVIYEFPTTFPMDSIPYMWSPVLSVHRSAPPSTVPLPRPAFRSPVHRSAPPSTVPLIRPRFRSLRPPFRSLRPPFRSKVNCTDVTLLNLPQRVHFL